MNEFEYIIIGKGLIGAATAFALSKISNSVALIGPNEPQDLASNSGPFGSHYDQGRITRIADPDPVWATLAKRSIEKYRSIEQESGVSFFRSVGMLFVGPKSGNNSAYIAETRETGRKFNMELRELSLSELRDRYPYFNFPDDSIGLLEEGTAGTINPRELIRAESMLFERNGGTIIREVVESIEGSKVNNYQGKKILLALGCHSKFSKLISQPIDLRVYKAAYAVAEVSKDSEELLASMPSVICDFSSHEILSGVYITPPMEYPDGKACLKLGTEYLESKYIESEEELIRWFQEGPTEKQKDDARKVIGYLFPNLEIENITVKSCTCTLSSFKRPLIHALDENRLFLATAGCGFAAKSSLEIGELAARFMERGEWNYDLEQRLFQDCC